MSQTLRVQFANDMPVAAVEIVAPDLQVVSRTMLSAGRSMDVDVPSERSFLRVHLPDGRVVTLDDPGKLERIISRASLRPRPARSLALKPSERLFALGEDAEAATESAGLEIGGIGSSGGRSERVYELMGDDALRNQERKKLVARGPGRRIETDRGDALPVRGGGTLQLVGPVNALGTSMRNGSLFRWDIEPSPRERWLELRYEGDGVSTTTSLPSSTTSVEVLYRARRRDRNIMQVKVRTRSEHADAILAYMARGDMYAAQALAEWADEAEQMVYHDDSDPYSGVVGAYLLLRLRDFDRMRDWVHQIADRFSFLPDGCIIWAWQLLHTRKAPPDDVRKYMFDAAARGLPVYSEGLRLLLDGLCLLGESGASKRREVLERVGNVVWESPFTTTTRFAAPTPHRSSAPAIEVTFAR